MRTSAERELELAEQSEADKAFGARIQGSDFKMIC